MKLTVHGQGYDEGIVDERTIEIVLTEQELDSIRNGGSPVLHMTEGERFRLYPVIHFYIRKDGAESRVRKDIQDRRGMKI